MSPLGDSALLPELPGRKIRVRRKGRRCRGRADISTSSDAERLLLRRIPVGAVTCVARRGEGEQRLGRARGRVDVDPKDVERLLHVPAMRGGDSRAKRDPTSALTSVAGSPRSPERILAPWTAPPPPLVPALSYGAGAVPCCSPPTWQGAMSSVPAWPARVTQAGAVRLLPLPIDRELWDVARGLPVSRGCRPSPRPTFPTPPCGVDAYRRCSPPIWRSSPSQMRPRAAIHAGVAMWRPRPLD